MERPYVCSKCGQYFTTQTNFKYHMAAVCGGDEKEREEVRRKKREAMRAFRARMKYACDLCDKRFGQKPGLVSHRRREHSM